MRVIAVTDCYYDNNYIRQGEHFDYDGPMDKDKKGKEHLPAGMARVHPEEPPKEKSLPSEGGKSKVKDSAKTSKSNDKNPFDGF